MRNNKYFIIFFLIIGVFVISSVLACCINSNDKLYSVENKNGLYIVKIDISKVTIEPYVSEKLETVKTIAEKTGALVAINTGFFDATNKKTVSYITKGNTILANPTENEHLTNNENLKPYLDRIYNRGEFRLYNCSGKIMSDITYHNESNKEDCTLINSTQAGPILLENMDLEKEYFVIERNGKIIRDGAGMTRKTDRSAIAIIDNFVYFIITDEQNPLTIYELQKKLKNMNFKKALGFDGGGSVSLFVKTNDGIFYQDREEKGASRKIKSALIVK